MLLSVSGLTVEYRQRGVNDRAVVDASLDVPAGKVIGLVGESGCGKSTLALALLGITRGHGEIVAGSVRFEGRELLGLSNEEWRVYRGGKIGLITQHPRGSLNPIQTVGEQISRHIRSHATVTAQSARSHALDLLASVGINDPRRRLSAFPHELSGGMAQRVLIALALSTHPELLIADEPTTALDVTTQAQIMDLLQELRTERGLAMLVISHDMGIVANYCDQVYVMSSAEIVEEAGVKDIFTDPRHPAAIALLAAQRARYSHEAVRLRGLPVDTRNPPSGCRLHRRCPFATPRAGCDSIHPHLEVTGDGVHLVRCHRASITPRLAERLSSTGALKEPSSV